MQRRLRMLYKRSQGNGIFGRRGETGKTKLTAVAQGDSLVNGSTERPPGKKGTRLGWAEQLLEQSASAKPQEITPLESFKKELGKSQGGARQSSDGKGSISPTEGGDDSQLITGGRREFWRSGQRLKYLCEFVYETGTRFEKRSALGENCLFHSRFATLQGKRRGLGDLWIKGRQRYWGPKSLES